MNRLRPFLNNLIGPLQSSFLPGRGTCDNAIILQEIIHNMQRSKKKKGEVVFKIDLEKAYDHVNWHYLKDCLSDFGFPPIAIKLIMHCVSSSSLSLIWNGKRLPTFAPSRGLGQGDPLSPYLFVICMEKLSLAINEGVQDKRWLPIKVSRNGPSFSHLLFADDVLLFSKARCSQARVMADIFFKFGQHSGLKVNLTKSKAFFSAGVQRRKKDKITSITSIRHTDSLDRYLGFPMLKGTVKKEHFNFLLEKLQTRLSSWKNKLLNKVGRLTLAKSVLNSIPIYYMQLQWVLAGVCNRIDKLSRDFIWKGVSRKGIHLVGWNTITRPKKEGGLGVRKARESNTAMLGKLVWELHTQSEKPWVNMLLSKYVPNRFVLEAPPRRGSPVWNSIFKAIKALKEGFKFRVGNGTSSFWFTPWSSLGPLSSQVSFIDLQDIDLKIQDVFQHNECHLENMVTNLPNDMKSVLQGSPLVLNASVQDAFVWGSRLDGNYSAKEGYRWLCDHTLEVQPNLSWSWIWKTATPEKLKFFIWCMCHRAIPTMSLLHHRGMAPSDMCQRCRIAEESILHCVRDCHAPRSVWLSLGFSTNEFFLQDDVMLWIKEGLASGHTNRFLVGLWWNWKTRNACCLGNETFTHLQTVISANRWEALLNVCFADAGSREVVPRTVVWHGSREDHRS